jgi:tRNA-uridine 2-sulfurtransferase
VALGEPRYVVRLEGETGRVVLGAKEELGRLSLTASGANWLSAPPPGAHGCTAKIRYNARPATARVTALPNDRLIVEFEQPQFGVAPGQAVVCYDGEQVMGGGWID